MKNARLIKPEQAYMDSYLEACRELKERNLLLYSMRDPDTYHIWGPGLFENLENESKGINLKEGYVPSTTFWLVEDGEYIGEGNVRHSLTPNLLRIGGHIGYAIRASKWNMGYGTLQLSLLLAEAAKLGIDRALVTCNDENIGSSRVMEKNGGVYVDTIDNVLDGTQVRTRRYLIDTAPHLESLITIGARMYDMDMVMRSLTDYDVPFYKKFAGETTPAGQAGSHVLELGCGTGRVALELAKAGHCVTGLELSSAMLYALDEKLAKMPEAVRNNISVSRQSMANFSFKRKFNLIIAPACTFQALTGDSDISGCLNAVHNHLEPGGLFIVNVFRPSGISDGSWLQPERLVWEDNDPETGCRIVKYDRRESADTDNQILRSVITYAVTDKTGATETLSDRCALKYYYYEQLKKLLEYHGLSVIHEYGRYDFSPLDDFGELIFVSEAP